MNLTSAEIAKIKSYIDAVDANITGPDRDETLADLESHIYEAIAARAEGGDSSGIVETVISEMDSPESYRDMTPLTQSGICRLAISGAILLPLGLPILWHVISQTPAGERWEEIQFYNSSLYHLLSLPLGIVAMILSPILGFMSIKRIQRAKGALGGGLLAVIVAVFYPIVLLDLFLFVVAVNIMAMTYAVPIPFVILAFLIALIINAIICKSVYTKSGVNN
jgi:lipopolysaccharide export LptBFGC system permease protein LptF